jgi:hypothetical protein
MSRVLRATAVLAVAFVAIAVASAAFAVNPTEGVKLSAVGGSKVTGLATAGQRGKGTHVVFVVRGLEPGAKVRAVMHAGRCAKPGASFATAGTATADAKGVARWSAGVLFRGEPVAWSTISDGAHHFSIVGARRLACGVVPGMS